MLLSSSISDMISDNFSHILEIADIPRRAIDIAQFAHMGQRRRASGEPYVVHPTRAAGLAVRYGYSTDIVVAAMLHDTLEDTSGRRNADVRRAIASSYPNALSIVEELTHDPAVPYDEYFSSLSDDALVVKLCDVLSNVLDMPSDRQLRKYATAVEGLAVRTGGAPPNGVAVAHWNALLRVLAIDVGANDRTTL